MQRFSILLTLAGTLCLSIPSRPAFAADTRWPGLLGPERNGWVDYFQPPATWPDKLSQVWQVEVGTGYGTPLVADGRIYQHARQADDEVLWCIDLISGTTVWKQNHAVPFTAAGGAEWHGNGPKSSPVLADGRIFTISSLGEVTAWDADSGDMLWRRDYRNLFPQNHPNWGASTSPIVDDDRVIVHVGNDDAGVLVALDVTDGSEVWRQGNAGASYSSPVLTELHGVRQVVEWNHLTLAGIDSKTGQLLWDFPFPHEGPNQNMPTPVIHNGRILLGGENRGILSVEPKRTGDTWTVEQRWHQTAVALNMSTAVLNGDLLFGFSHYQKGQLFCLDTVTGDVLWRGPGRTGDNVAFLSLPGHVAALIDDGELKIIKATGEALEQVASYRVAESPTWAPPVLLPEGLLIKDQTSLTRWAMPSTNTPDKL